MTLTPAPTVRDSIETAITEVSQPTASPEIPAQETPLAQTSEAAEAPAPAQETASEKEARLRDEKGRFVEGKPEAKPKAPETPAAAAAPAKPKAPRPSSWKKELEAQWETLPPEVQAYIGDRERQFATGVSTYKAEADRAKEVREALAEFEPVLQQANIPVGKWIQSMGVAHRTLAMGAPQDKLAMVQQILANNRIPAQLAVQGADGQWQLLGAQQPQQPPSQSQPPQPSQQDISKLVAQTVEERLAAERADREWTAFSKEVQEGKYPHFEALKPTMSRLLETGFSKDYASAYDTALRMPEHADLFTAAQQQQTEKQEAERRAAEQAKVGKARSQAVSVKSSTPSAMTPAQGPQGLRDVVSAAFDKHAAPSRV